MTASNSYGRAVDLPLTNKSGGGVIAGDVVVIDTANNDAFTTDTAGAFVGTVGVAQDTIANNAVGRIRTSGYCALVNVNASVTRGHYGKTYTVAKQATDAGAARGVGTFCEFLTGGTTPDAVMWPVDLLGSSLTNPMTTTWDLIRGGTAGAPTALAIGAAGATLATGNSTIIWNAGSSFPGSKATNDRYYRTDLGYEAYWNGSNWLTTTEFAHPGVEVDLPGTASATPNLGRLAIPTDYDIYVTRIDFDTFIATTNDGTHFWTFTTTKVAVLNAAGVSLGSFTTAADTVSNWAHHQIVVNANVDRATYFVVVTAGAKTSTPGAPSWSMTYRYRLVLG